MRWMNWMTSAVRTAKKLQRLLASRLLVGAMQRGFRFFSAPFCSRTSIPSALVGFFRLFTQHRSHVEKVRVFCFSCSVFSNWMLISLLKFDYPREKSRLFHVIGISRMFEFKLGIFFIFFLGIGFWFNGYIIVWEMVGVKEMPFL